MAKRTRAPHVFVLTSAAIIVAGAAAEEPPRSLTRACGGCHVSTSADSKAEALAAFDLDDREWTRALTPEQWQAFGRRVSASAKLDTKEREEIVRWMRRFTPAPS